MKQIFEGWNIGSTAIKRVRILEDGTIEPVVMRHGGRVKETIEQLLADSQQKNIKSIYVTGPLVESFFNLPYKPESICAEIALEFLGQSPDMLLSLGGENFIVYCLQNGNINNLLSTSKCAAGSGEFLIQQFARMGFDIEEGLRQAKSGKQVKLASRCSVHCKSDATHKLNKAECTAADIACSLIADLAQKIKALMDNANWPVKNIVLMGGLSRNDLLIAELNKLFPDSKINVLEHSEYLEALGAAIAARRDSVKLPAFSEWLSDGQLSNANYMAPLSQFVDKVTRVSHKPCSLQDNMQVVLGLDAGSTTTKAALIDYKSGEFILGCYLRTHGNPVRATVNCFENLKKQVGDKNIEIVQLASTGSGREMTSIFLDNSLSFNEILAHARAAREYCPNVDTIFEIGGQDAKFIALNNGLPIDYAMNDGCSAGTGSFLEESAASDLQLKTEEIGDVAIKSRKPQAYGERCAAFINSEIRDALQQGVARADIVAGLVYSIMENYITRVVGTRFVGKSIVLQGGVALNKAVALATASRTGSQVVIPPRPELMGAIGAALMARDLIIAKQININSYSLASFDDKATKEVGRFVCHACTNHCEILRIAIGDEVYPFGGLCSKWEMARRPQNLRQASGENLIDFRQKLMFVEFSPKAPKKPRGKIGLPLALTTYELYPFYAKLITELGFEVILSAPRPDDLTTVAPLCYPMQIVHGAVQELLEAGVDHIFLPFVGNFKVPKGHKNSFYCPATQTAAAMVKQFVQGAKIVTPAFCAQIDLEGSIEKADSQSVEASCSKDHGEFNLIEVGTDKLKTSLYNLRSWLNIDNLKNLLGNKKDIEQVCDKLFLSPELDFAKANRATSRQEIIRMAKILGVSEEAAIDAFKVAWDYQKEFTKTYRAKGQKLLAKIKGPKVILVGRPYVAYAPAINMSLPQKIISRGFSVVPGDLLPFAPIANERNVWHYTQQILSAVEYVKKHDDCYLCYLSCFSCGPDAITHHRISKEMEQNPFCYLEIDSHSAHAGIETRIGAYLEIIEAQRQNKKRKVLPVGKKYKPAKLVMAGGKPKIITSSRESVELTNKRVVHVILYNMPDTIGQMMTHFNRGMGFNVVIPARATDADRHLARSVCSGRECLPFLSIIGMMLRHLANRPQDEITNFVVFDQDGPCVNGAWFDAIPLILERLQLKDALVSSPRDDNNSYGKGIYYRMAMVASEILGDLFYEMTSSIECLAKKPKVAKRLFSREFKKVAKAAEKGIVAAELSLRQMAKTMAKVPLARSVKDVPKILIIGGIARAQIDMSIKNFFEERGILVKVNDATEFLSYLVYESIMKSSFELGRRDPKDQLSWLPLIMDVLNPAVADKSRRMSAVCDRLGIGTIEMFYNHWHSLAKKSGLIFSNFENLHEVLSIAHPYVPSNRLSEAGTTLGRYLLAAKNKFFDGVVNLRTFNCGPANASEALIRPIANLHDILYVSLEVDSEQLTSGQILELETLAEQCKKRYES